MRTRTALSCALVLAVQGANLARSDDHLPMPRSVPEPPTAAAAQAGEHYGYYDPVPEPKTLPNGLYEPGRLDSYSIYDYNHCCECFGKHGPINLELYVRSGATWPTEGGIFHHRLKTGWTIEGGGRSLFFNAPGNRAFTIDLNISNTTMAGTGHNLPVPLINAAIPNPNFIPNFPPGPNNLPDFFATVPVTIRHLNRTFVSCSLGQEYFFPLPWLDCGHWRCGYDIGGRWGTANLELNDASLVSGFRRLNDVIGTFFFAVHADVEVPCDFGILSTGLRFVYNYNWMSLLPVLNNDLEEVSLMVTLGVRF